MANQTLVQDNAVGGVGPFQRKRQVRLAISKGLAWLPPLLRPGLLREAVCLAAIVKNRSECIRELYFRDRPPRRVEFRNGICLESSERDSLFFLVEEIFASRCYTPRWFYNPGPSDVVVDIGANIGVFAAHICSLSAGARVGCFEPDSSSHQTLLRNIRASSLERRVQVHQMAVWREPGVVYLALSSHDSSIAQSVVARSEGSAQAVRSVNLSEAMELTDSSGGPIALLKIDAEGAETDILEAAGAAAMRRVQRVALEYHSDEKHKVCEKLLQSYGFHVRQGIGDANLGVCLAFRETRGGRNEGAIG